MHYGGRDSHATSRTANYANITQTGRIRVYCSWFWVVLVGFVGFVGGFGWFWVVLLLVLGGFGSFWVVLGRFGWFWVVPCFSNYDTTIWKPGLKGGLYQRMLLRCRFLRLSFFWQVRTA